VVIGVTGSILVFEKELEHVAWPQLWQSSGGTGDLISFPTALAAVRNAYPGYEITVGYVPDKPGNNYEVFAHSGSEIRYVFVDASTGRIAGDIDPDHSRLIWIIDLHFRLLAGKIGLLINGICSACLLLLCVTGIVIWWVGLARWTRGLKIDFRRRWKRINYDMHSAVGFWTLAIVSMWAFTGVYFTWPRQIESAVNCISSVASANPPKFDVPARGDGPWADLNGMIRRAELSSPKARFAGAFFPARNKGALTLLMARGEPRNFTTMNYVYFDPETGRQLAIWHRGFNTTLGAKFVFWLSPLHFGYDWGLAIKVLWAALGLSLPLLAITGVIMYWNRSLSKKWKSLGAAKTPALARTESAGR
jgi:uncharacterized iron-regulated membrane protein